MQHIIYGEGGFDPSKPNNNIVAIEETEDPVPAAPTTEERLDALTDAVEALAFDLLMGGL